MAAVVNARNGMVLAARVACVRTFLGRLRGLLGTEALPEGEGLWISPCGQVHSIGMRYAIDVLFLDARGRVIALYRDFPPIRVTRYFFRAGGALELPAGTISRTDTVLGDPLEFRD